MTGRRRGRSPRRLRALPIAFLLTWACACQGITYDEHTDRQAAEIVEFAGHLPDVAAATYRYVHGLDAGQRIEVTVVVRAEAVGSGAGDPLLGYPGGGEQTARLAAPYAARAPIRAIRAFAAEHGVSVPLRIAVYSTAAPPCHEEDGPKCPGERRLAYDEGR